MGFKTLRIGVLELDSVMTKKSVCLGFMAFVVAFDLPGCLLSRDTQMARRGEAAAAVRAADNGA